MGKKDMSQVMKEWKACEVIVKQREKEMQSAIFAKLSSGSSIDSHVLRLRQSTLCNEVFMSVDEPDAGGQDTPGGSGGDTPGLSTVVPLAAGGALAPDERPLVEFDSPDSGLPSSRNYSVTSGILSSIDDGTEEEEARTHSHSEMEEEARTHSHSEMEEEARTHSHSEMEERQESLSEERLCSQLDKLMTNGNGGAEGMPSLSSYTIELLDTVALNLHRIDKDVQRCDRNYYYFTTANLEKLRNVMCSYVWDHLEMECLAYSCFTQLMKRMSQNFPNGGAMDTHFANMRSLIQILDPELFELMHQNGDYTHFYFCYRWFLLDFKREMLYQDVFSVWEVIWVAPRISSQHFVLFLALALRWQSVMTCSTSFRSPESWCTRSSLSSRTSDEEEDEQGQREKRRGREEPDTITAPLDQRPPALSITETRDPLTSPSQRPETPCPLNHRDQRPPALSITETRDPLTSPSQRPETP
ncbi:unnamed protein product [Coregonus sp. 'balchen']|nr:unnamed protein product [Coregonus sp. 'balchen']